MDIRDNNTFGWKPEDLFWFKNREDFDRKILHPEASINIGAGLNLIHRDKDNWINHDGDFNENLDVVCRWENFSFIPDKTFVECRSTDTLEHIMPISYDKVFTEWNRILKIGAKFSATTPNRTEIIKRAYEGKESDEWVIRNLFGDQNGYAHHHYHVFTKKELQEVLEKYGFGEVKFDPIEGWISVSATKVRDI